MASDTLESTELPQTAYRRFRRNLFTNELEEVWDNPVAAFEVINRRSRENTDWMARKGGYKNPYDTGKDHVDRAMSLKPEDVTPERIAHENEMCKRHGTGAYYDGKGQCRTPTRSSRAREMARPHHGGFQYQDNDAGYSDRAGG